MKPWLSLIGLGEDGELGPAARARLSQAALVVGGARHLALVGEIQAERLAWPSPMHDAFPAIFARRGENVCVLASGDPFFYGVGSVLARELGAGGVRELSAALRLHLSRPRGSAGRCRIAC